MFGLFKKKAVDLFSAAEKAQIIDAIQDAERRTSGEVRVYVESSCVKADPLGRAMELFQKLKMYETASRNAVLVYIATEDRKLAVFGDEGIHQKVGHAFWNSEVEKILMHFNKHHFGQGIASVVQAIGAALELHFPFDGTSDKNELPDDIVFGK